MHLTVRGSIAALGIGLLAVAATGCTTSTSSSGPTVTKTVTITTPAPKPTILPGDTDTSAAAVCGQFSAFFTVETNATTAAANGTISTAVESEVLSTIVTGMRNTSSSDTGVRKAQAALAAALSSPQASSPGLPYDPAGTEYRAAQQQLVSACSAAGSRISEYASTGG